MKPWFWPWQRSCSSPYRLLVSFLRVSRKRCGKPEEIGFSRDLLLALRSKVEFNAERERRNIIDLARD